MRLDLWALLFSINHHPPYWWENLLDLNLCLMTTTPEQIEDRHWVYFEMLSAPGAVVVLGPHPDRWWFFWPFAFSSNTEPILALFSALDSSSWTWRSFLVRVIERLHLLCSYISFVYTFQRVNVFVLSFRPMAVLRALEAELVVLGRGQFSEFLIFWITSCLSCDSTWTC